jgi:3-oxoacyl-[acyl-carrier protein] reductase
VVYEIRARGRQAIAVQADVANRGDVQAMVAAVHEAFGAVDIMVCNAAYYPWHPWYEIEETVSSVTVELGWRPYVHYVTTKAGLIGFTRSLAREAGKNGIRVNCVMPGAIGTEQEVADFPDQRELSAFLTQPQCLPQRGMPDDLVGAVVYLASAESDFVTGQVVTVDGGWVHY